MFFIFHVDLDSPKPVSSNTLVKTNSTSTKSLNRDPSFRVSTIVRPSSTSLNRICDWADPDDKKQTCKKSSDEHCRPLWFVKIQSQSVIDTYEKKIRINWHSNPDRDSNPNLPPVANSIMISSGLW